MCTTIISVAVCSDLDTPIRRRQDRQGAKYVELLRLDHACDSSGPRTRMALALRLHLAACGVGRLADGSHAHALSLDSWAMG